MKRLLTITAPVTAFLLPAMAVAQQVPAIVNIEAPSEPEGIPLYDGKVGSRADEIWTLLGPLKAVRNVTRPTITPVLPDPKKATGTAVIVAPGGGLIMLAMDDSWKVARALADRGIAAFVLKYRLVPTPASVENLMPFLSNLNAQSRRGEVVLSDAEGDADGQAAIEMVRNNADRWGINSSRVGMLGFSSGARIARFAALSSNTRGRPDFIGIVYGAFDHIDVPAYAPPLFAAVALDDKVLDFEGFPVVQDWRKAHRPVELHAYQSGGHGFAIDRKGATTSMLLDQFTAWLAMQGLLGGHEPIAR